MIPRRILSALATAAVLTAFVAIAYAPASAAPYAFGGLSLPVGDFGDAYNAGFNLGAGYDYPVTPQASVGVRGAFNRNSLDEFTDEDDEGDPITIEGHVQLIELLATGKLAAPNGLFGFAGLGLTFSSGEYGGADVDSESNFTAAVGGGYRMMRWEFTALYHTVDAEGGSLDYVTLTAGIGF